MSYQTMPNDSKSYVELFENERLKERNVQLNSARSYLEKLKSQLVELLEIEMAELELAVRQKGDVFGSKLKEYYVSARWIVEFLAEQDDKEDFNYTVCSAVTLHLKAVTDCLAATNKEDLERTAKELFNLSLYLPQNLRWAMISGDRGTKAAASIIVTLMTLITIGVVVGLITGSSVAGPLGIVGGLIVAGMSYTLLMGWFSTILKVIMEGPNGAKKFESNARVLGKSAFFNSNPSNDLIETSSASTDEQKSNVVTLNADVNSDYYVNLFEKEELKTKKVLLASACSYLSKLNGRLALESKQRGEAFGSMLKDYSAIAGSVVDFFSDRNNEFNYTVCSAVTLHLKAVTDCLAATNKEGQIKTANELVSLTLNLPKNLRWTMISSPRQSAIISNYLILMALMTLILAAMFAASVLSGGAALPLGAAITYAVFYSLVMGATSVALKLLVMEGPNNANKFESSAHALGKSVFFKNNPLNEPVATTASNTDGQNAAAVESSADSEQPANQQQSPKPLRVS